MCTEGDGWIVPAWVMCTQLVVSVAILTWAAARAFAHPRRVQPVDGEAPSLFV